MKRYILALPLIFLPGLATADVGAFHASDADESGSLDYGEFTTLVSHMAASGRRIAIYVERTGLYGTAFGRVDSDGDGLATPTELLAAQAWLEAYGARRDARAAAQQSRSEMRRTQ